MRFAGIALAALTALAPAQGWAQDAGARYAAAYRATGFRLRATYVCPGDKKAMLNHAFVSVSSPEFKTFSQAYPKTIQQWMTEGADVFNGAVMQEGIEVACRRAR